MLASRQTLIIAGLLVGGALLWASKRGPGGVGQQIGASAVDLADGVLSGVVTTTGGIFGVPETDASQAAIDRANGDIWAASFSMPAGEWIRWVFNGAQRGGATGSW